MEARAGCIFTGEGCRSELGQSVDHAPVRTLPIWRAETPDRFIERRDSRRHSTPGGASVIQRCGRRWRAW